MVAGGSGDSPTHTGDRRGAKLLLIGFGGFVAMVAALLLLGMPAQAQVNCPVTAPYTGTPHACTVVELGPATIPTYTWSVPEIFWYQGPCAPDIQVQCSIQLAPPPNPPTPQTGQSLLPDPIPGTRISTPAGDVGSGCYLNSTTPHPSNWQKAMSDVEPIYNQPEFQHCSYVLTIYEVRDYEYLRNQIHTQFGALTGPTITPTVPSIPPTPQKIVQACINYSHTYSFTPPERGVLYIWTVSPPIAHALGGCPTPNMGPEQNYIMHYGALYYHAPIDINFFVNPPFVAYCGQSGPGGYPSCNGIAPGGGPGCTGIVAEGRTVNLPNKTVGAHYAFVSSCPEAICVGTMDAGAYASTCVDREKITDDLVALLDVVVPSVPPCWIYAETGTWNGSEPGSFGPPTKVCLV